MSEETNDLTNESHSNVKQHMESEVFEAKLTELFSKHKQSKLRLVSKIAFEFKGQEDIVLEHLHNKYVLRTAAPAQKEKTVQQLEERPDAPKNSEAPSVENPKSKKKLIIIIIVIVVLGGLGATGFMMKDKIMGMLGKGHKTEQEAPKEKVAIESKTQKAKENITPQQVEAILDSLDTTKAAPKDSAKTE